MTQPQHDGTRDAVYIDIDIDINPISSFRYSCVDLSLVCSIDPWATSIG